MTTPTPVPVLPKTFDHVRCGTCGVPLEEHTAECSRHPYLDPATVAAARRSSTIARFESAEAKFDLEAR